MLLRFEWQNTPRGPGDITRGKDNRLPLTGPSIRFVPSHSEGMVRSACVRVHFVGSDAPVTDNKTHKSVLLYNSEIW